MQSEIDTSTRGTKNNMVMIGAVLIVLFFAASAYGVQRTALSLRAEAESVGSEEISAEEWIQQQVFLQIALTLSFFGIAKSAADILSGVYSDVFGRKRLIITGTALFVAGTFPMVFLDDVLILSLANALIGAGEGCLFAASMAALSDLGGHKERALAMGIMESSVYAGYSGGAILAGFLASWGDLSTPFLFAFFVVFLALMAAIFTVQETIQFSIEEKKEIEAKKSRPLSSSEEKTPYTLKGLMRNSTILSSYANGQIAKCADATMVLFLPLLLSTVNQLPIDQVGIVASSFTVVWAVIMPFSGRISDRVGRKTPVIIGLLIQAIMLSTFALLPPDTSIYYLILVSGLAGLGTGLYYPILPSISVDVAPPEVKAKVLGLYRAAKDLGYTTGPLFVGLIATLTYSSGGSLGDSLKIPFYATSGIILLGAILVLLFVKETRPGWFQYSQVLLHAETVLESVTESARGIEVFVSPSIPEIGEEREDIFAEVKARARAAKKLEVKADMLLEEIALSTYSSIRKAPDSADFLTLGRRFDRAAGLMVGAVSRLRKIPLDTIPSIVRKSLEKAAPKMVFLTTQTVDGLRLLDIRIPEVERLTRGTRETEKELDILYRVMSRHLLKNSDSLPIGVLLGLKEAIDLIEEAADIIEDAAEVIQILGIKYSA